MTDKLCECGCGEKTRIATQNNARRDQVKGQPFRFIFGHSVKHLMQHVCGERKSVTKSYRMKTQGGTPRFVHRLRAEAALGHPLPPKAVVHHADGSKGDHAPLVVCQDAAYHRLLHRRMRIKAAGGNPNTDLICSSCQMVKHADQFPHNRSTPTGHSYNCKSCKAELDRQRAS